MPTDKRKQPRELATWIFAARLFHSSGEEISFVPFEASAGGVGILTEMPLSTGDHYVMLLQGGLRIDLVCRVNDVVHGVIVSKILYRVGLEGMNPEINIAELMKHNVIKR